MIFNQESRIADIQRLSDGRYFVMTDIGGKVQIHLSEGQIIKAATALLKSGHHFEAMSKAGLVDLAVALTGFEL